MWTQSPLAKSAHTVVVPVHLSVASCHHCHMPVFSVMFCLIFKPILKVKMSKSSKECEKFTHNLYESHQVWMTANLFMEWYDKTFVPVG